MEKIDVQSPIAHKMSSAQLRKIKKPIIEKRRRERINDSLNTLKTLVLGAMQKDESRYSKMEKADILEMTVHHLKNVHRRQKLITATEDQTLSEKYNAGFTECASEVNQFLTTSEGLSPELKLRIMSHLSQSMQRSSQRVSRPVQQMSPVGSPAFHIPLSPPNSPVSIPCGTQINSLPGSSPVHRYSPNLVDNVPSLNLVTSPVAVHPSSLIFISPQSTNSSPQHSPSSVNSAIPLYVSPNGHGYSAVSPTQVSYHQDRRSPIQAEDAPSHFSRPAFSSEDLYRIRDTVIATNNNNSMKMQVSDCKSQSRFSNHPEMATADDRDMWRPW